MAIDLARIAPASVPAAPLQRSVSIAEDAHSAVCDAYNSASAALDGFMGDTPSPQFAALQSEVIAELREIRARLDALAWKSDALSTDGMRRDLQSARLQFKDADGNTVLGYLQPDGRGGSIVKTDTPGWSHLILGTGKDDGTAIDNARWYVGLRFEVVPLKG